MRPETRPARLALDAAAGSIPRVGAPLQLARPGSAGYAFDTVTPRQHDISNSQITHPAPALLPVGEPLRPIMEALAREGYRGFIAGGAVRDALLGLHPKDLDVEVYGCTYEQLGKVLRRFGRVSTVGRQFGILKLASGAGARRTELDFSVPRRENRIGIAHTDFATAFDPTMSPREAAERRDFTCNALLYDPLTNELHDYFGGERDLRARILRHTSEKFREDPLRVLRGMQFAARFDLGLASETAALARDIAEEIAALVGAQGQEPDRIPTEVLSRERVAEEWMKLAVQGNRPGSAIDYLVETGWIRFFPEICDIVFWPRTGQIGIPQEPEWHPEGPVHVHTALVMDAAARIAGEERLAGDDRAILVLAALTHDFAKAWTTHRAERIDARTGKASERWVSPGHDDAGGYLTARFLLGAGIKHDLIRRVVPLVRNHLQHLHFHGEPSEWSRVVDLADRLQGPLFPLKRRGGDRAARAAAVEREIARLGELGIEVSRAEFDRWAALGRGRATVRELALLMRADHAGRPPLPADTVPGVQRMLEWAREAKVLAGPLEPILRGQDLIDRGLSPGEEFGRILEAAREAQRDRRFGSRPEGERWLDQYLARTFPLITGQDMIDRGLAPGPAFAPILAEARRLQADRRLRSREEALAWLGERLRGE
jgi:tRNA nucleotidyltransferase (CCA-adding enzyme)